MAGNSQQTIENNVALATPAPWVVRWLHGMSAGATILDLACGAGRHATFAAGLGLDVLAVDRNASALAGLRPPIRTLQCDLEAGDWPFADQRFDAVVVTNYLYRPKLDDLCALLAPGGRLIYATFGRGNEAYGRPSNPDFLLAPGELLEVAQRNELRVAGFESGLAGEPTSAVIERICAWRCGVTDVGIPIECPVNA